MTTFHDLPLFADLRKTDHWPSYLGQMIDAEYIWVKKQQQELYIPAALQAYFNTVLSLWETAAIVAGNGKQHFAAYSLRAILERVALLWAAHPDVALDPQTLVANFESDDRKIRTVASNDVFDAVVDKDKVLVELYGILSRYFGHISHLDRVPISYDDPKDKLLATRAQIIPLLLLFDVGHCVANLVGELLTAQGKIPPPIVSGRSGKVNPHKFVRLAAYVMCERHTVKQSVNFGCLYKGIKGIVGEIGITDIYRGGMVVFRYGSAVDEKPTHKALAEFAIFIVGYTEADKIKVKLEKELPKGEQYLISWPKTFEIDGSALAIKASDYTDAYPFFDYVSAFIKVIEAHEKFKVGDGRDAIASMA